MEKMPRVVRVQAEANRRLRVLFDDGTEKEYDWRPLMNRAEFDALKNESLLRLVHVDPGGYSPGPLENAMRLVELEVEKYFQS